MAILWGSAESTVSCLGRADAFHEFLTLERHTALSSWKQAHLAPRERRVLAGVSVILRFDLADQDPELLAALAENERRRALKQEYSDAFLAANPKRKRATLTPEQEETTRLIESRWPFRLRIVLDGVDCDLATALNLSGFAAGDQAIIATRSSFDERLPVEEEIDERRVEHSVDTLENRFVKLVLEICVTVIERMRQVVAADQRPSAFTVRVARDCTVMAQTIQPILQQGLWAQVGRLSQLPTASTVLQERRGYREGQQTEPEVARSVYGRRIAPPRAHTC